MKRQFVLMFIIMVVSIAEVSYAAGEERFVFTDLTAKDKETGLMWTRNANIANKALTWNEALKFIEKLNKQKYAGYNDWWFPTVKELQTLTDYAKSQRYNRNIYILFRKIGFRNLQANYYWSSTPYAVSMANTWDDVLDSGGLGANIEHFSFYVWPVRGGQ